MKLCCKCNEYKELSAYSTAKTTLDGLQTTCKECIKAYNKAYRERNKEQLSNHKKEYYQANSEAAKERARKHRAENYERKKQLDKVWRDTNKEHLDRRAAERYQRNPEIGKARAKKWREDNRDRVLAQIAKRRAQKLNATPAWADDTKIATFYAEAVRLTKETGIKHQVDHIIPLNSDLVCGLHVETNLQVLTADDNNKKKNKFNPDEHETIKNPA